MSGWPGRAFAIFSLLWGLLIAVALLILFVIRNGYVTDGPDSNPQQLSLIGALVVSAAGGTIWYEFYRLMRWFDGKQ